MDNELHAIDKKLTAKEAAKMLKLKPDTVIENYFKGRNGKPPLIAGFQHVPKGNWFVMESEVNRFLNQRV